MKHERRHRIWHFWKSLHVSTSRWRNSVASRIGTSCTHCCINDQTPAAVVHRIEVWSVGMPPQVRGDATLVSGSSEVINQLQKETIFWQLITNLVSDKWNYMRQMQLKMTFAFHKVVRVRWASLQFYYVKCPQDSVIQKLLKSAYFCWIIQI